MTTRRSDPPGMGAPARSKEHLKGIQRAHYTKKTGTLQSDWKRRALRAYDAGRLSLYEIRRIFGLHFEEFTGGAR